MKKDSENVIVVKSYAYSIRIVRCYQHLCDKHKEYDISRQLLRSGTSVAANIKEGLRAQSRPDFISKLSIALKEANESEHWLELLRDTDYLTDIEVTSMLDDCKELLKILTAIIKSTKLHTY